MIRVPIHHDSDVVMARKRARELAVEQGLSGPAVEQLAIAVTEIARNIIVHAAGGEVLLDRVSEGGRRGIAVVASDDGPGIADTNAAMRDHYTTGSGLGLGLPGARGLVDEFELVSAPGVGTTVRMKKWES